MFLKKFTCRAVAALLIVGGIALVSPAENVHAADSSATDRYTKEIQQNPKDVDAYFNRGLMYNGEQNDKAIADFSMVIKLEPNEVRGYLHRGIAYRNAGQYDKAVQDFNKVISLEPQNALNYMNRGYAYYLAKNYDKARADYKTAIKKDSAYDPSIENDLAKLGIKLDLNPHNSAQAYYGLGLIDYDEKNYAAALENFNKAIADTEKPMFYEARAKCHKALGNDDKARTDLKRAAELNKAQKENLDRMHDSVAENLEMEVEDDE